jgi:hypothetical protein
MNKLSSADRKSLIKLASSLPKGSPERKTILAGLAQTESAEAFGGKRANSSVKLPGFPGLRWETSRIYDDGVGPLSAMPAKYRKILGWSWLITVSPEEEDETDFIVALKRNGFSKTDTVRGDGITHMMFENDQGLVVIIGTNDYGADMNISLSDAHQLSGKRASGAWVPASRFPRMLELTQYASELGMEPGREVPEREWAKAERDLSRMPKFSKDDLIDLGDALDTGELEPGELPESVIRAVDALY